jgi:hypothetical protein
LNGFELVAAPAIVAVVAVATKTVAASAAILK